jgi:16S rRNA (guanine1207-N2)-methyltransferase
MSHYYITDNNLKNESRTFSYDYKGKRLSFLSDLGVFSKDRLDFGTHVLLQSLPDFSDRKSLIDVGCGVGCIGICLKKAYPNLEVLMLDVHDRCIELTKKNIENNKIEATVLKSSLYENVNGSYEIIISNPPIRAGKKIVFGVVEDGFDLLKNGGEVYIVIQKKQGADSMKKKMEEVYGNVEVISKEKGYFVFKSIKR